MKIKLAFPILVLALIVPNFVAANDSSFISSVDVMKYTKDTVRNQPSDAEIQSIVSTIMQKIKPKYIAISVPLDDSNDYPADGKPAPRSAIDFTQKWVDTIHQNGGKVIFRGTWSGIEGIYGFKKLVGSDRIPAQTWLDKTSSYITAHPNLFSSGDIWAVLPERTEGIFQDSTSFLSYDSPGIQTNYANFFSNLNKVSADAFAKIGKSVKEGYSANNFSEVASGWLLPSMYDSEPLNSVDHYGINHTVSEMQNDLTAGQSKYDKQMFLQEWGDYWNSSMSESDRSNYLKSMYSMLAQLASSNILSGFNYWGGWVNSDEGILTESNGSYDINYRGKLLADFFASLGSSSSTSGSTDTSYETPYATPYATPAYETPSYSYETPYATPYATPYSYETPYPTPYATPVSPLPEKASPKAVEKQIQKSDTKQQAAITNIIPDGQTVDTSIDSTQSGEVAAPVSIATTDQTTSKSHNKIIVYLLSSGSVVLLVLAKFLLL